MLLALGAASSVIDALQSLTSQKSSSAGQPPANPFDVAGSATASSGGATSSQPVSGFSPISPQTMSALIAAQGETTNTAPTNPSAALQDLFSQIDANGDGSITKTEFENALGAGGTNTAAADNVFGKLDSNGDGSVSLDEMKSALQGAGGHHGHGHHMHAHSGGGSGSSDGSGDPGADPLLQALSGASSTSVTNSDGSTTTSITYADGSKVSLTTPAASTTSPGSNSATSTYNLVEQLIQREAQALSASVASSLSVSV
jgi:hypothetical protein